MLPDTKALICINEIMNGPIDQFDSIESILLSKNLLVKTDDGTLTIRSDSDSELMHSTIGAIKEAFEKFVYPSALAAIDKPKILDLCSGLGYNSLAALIQNQNCSIDMLEICPEIIFLSKYLNNSYSEKERINDAVDCFFNKRPFNRLQILCGDARTILSRTVQPIYDIVFHDGFSPANEPVLYTVDFLTILYKCMKQKAILLSYSSSIPFRSALIEAGFFIGEGPSVGRKRGITIASKLKDDPRITSRLTFDDEKLIALSSIGIPYRDKSLSADRKTVNDDRIRIREKYKETHRDLSTKKINKNIIDKKYYDIYTYYSNSRDSVLAMKNYLFSVS